MSLGRRPHARLLVSLPVMLGVEVAISSLQTTASGRSQVFNALSPFERNHLLRWQETARDLGIDAVEDLTNRAWPCPLSGAVIGIFQTGENTASWMIVGQNGLWVAANCFTGIVSDPVESLEQALLVISGFSDDDGT